MLSNRLLVQSFKLEYLEGASLVHIPSVDGSHVSRVLPPSANFSKSGSYVPLRIASALYL
nr:MAG TPA: hypothetical protein [Caudoviricetes sp.]